MPSTTKHRPPNKVLNSLKFDLPGKYDPLNTASKPPLELTYSFDPAAIARLDLGQSGWSAFSNAQKEAVRDTLAEYATFINVSFVEKSGGGDIDLAFGRTSLGSDGLGGIQWRAGTGFFDLDGYTIFDTSEPLTDAYGRHLMLHEIGHGMTLKHPGNYGGDEGPFLGGAKENNKYSVMSYRDNPDSGELADHLMLYDIAALQSRFGANLDYRTGDDVYTAPDGRLEVIWDAGGTDTIDGSGYGSALKIDLRDGHFTSLGQKDNFAIAYRGGDRERQGRQRERPAHGQQVGQHPRRRRRQRHPRRRQGRRQRSPAVRAATRSCSGPSPARAETRSPTSIRPPTRSVSTRTCSRASAARGRCRRRRSTSARARRTGATASSTTTRRAS